MFAHVLNKIAIIYLTAAVAVILGVIAVGYGLYLLF